MRRFASWISVVDALRARAPAGVAALERRRGELRGDLPGLRAAHPVGDGEERRRDDVVVLVAAAPAPRVARDRVCADAARPLRLLHPQVGLADAEDVARARAAARRRRASR